MTELVNQAASTADEYGTLEIRIVVFDDGSLIRFFEKLSLPLAILDGGTSGECYFAEYPELGISAVGVDFDELQRCMDRDICMTWKRVFRKPEDDLTENDKKIKQHFLELAEMTNKPPTNNPL